MGTVIAVGLLLVGGLLQLTLGAIDWQLLSSPVNLILLLIILLALGVSYALRKRIYAVAWAMTQYAAVPAIVCGVAVTLVMGLTGWDAMLQSWPLVLSYAWMMAIVGWVAIDRAVRLCTGRSVRQSRIVTFTSLLNHAGLFLAMVCGTLGNADMQRLHMTVRVGHPERFAVDVMGQGLVHPLPLSIQLHRFTIDQYPPQYAIIDNATGQVLADAPWQVAQDTLLEFSTPRTVGDGYEASGQVGACTAAFVTATPLAEAEASAMTEATAQVQGWVSCGSFMHPYSVLPLTGQHSLVMLEPEPRRYASEVTVSTADGQTVDAVIEVNRPLEVDGWKVYQLSYDQTLGRWSDVSVFELVRDPWLPWVYAGIYMLLAGAVLTFLIHQPKPRS